MDLDQLRQMMQEGTLGELVGDQSKKAALIPVVTSANADPSGDVIKEARLYFKEGKSDKVYNVQIIRGGSGYRVTAQYGRRGKLLTNVVKGAFSMHPAAQITFNEVVRGKTEKGYKHC